MAGQRGEIHRRARVVAVGIVIELAGRGVVEDVVVGVVRDGARLADELTRIEAERARSQHRKREMPQDQVVAATCEVGDLLGCRCGQGE